MQRLQSTAGNRAVALQLQRRSWLDGQSSRPVPVDQTRMPSDPGEQFAASVTRQVQRQHAPADAGPPAGAPPQVGPAAQPAPPATAAENAEVELPQEGSLPIVFSETPRTWKLDTEELNKLKIGAGQLSIPPVPAAKWLSVAGRIGAEDGGKVDAGLTLSPVRGEIAGALIAAKRPSHATAGMIGAAIGGIHGGLLGGAVGLVGGLPGALYGARWGAGFGGAHFGRAAEAIAARFDGRLKLTATLHEGAISGHLSLHYEPFLGLTLSATGFSWLADLDAKLQTWMDLRLRPSASLAGSLVELEFEGGKLVRSHFSVTPRLTMAMNFAAMARLMIALRLLPFMNRARFPDAGDATVGPVSEVRLLQSDRFRLFDLSTSRSLVAALRLVKGSPLELEDSKLGIDEATSMKALVPEAMAKGQPLPSGDEPPTPGSPGAGPVEADFALAPGDVILVRSTARLGGRQGWFRGEVLGFERRSATRAGDPGETLFLVYQVQFPNQTATIRTNGAEALNDLNMGDAAVRLRRFADPVLRESLAPYLNNPLLRVGANDAGSIPATGAIPSQRERDLIQPIGNAGGCHIGTGHSTGGRSWVADHQRPTALVDARALLDPGPQRLYPMCPADSSRQGALVRNILRMWLGRAP